MSGSPLLRLGKCWGRTKKRSRGFVNSISKLPIPDLLSTSRISFPIDPSDGRERSLFFTHTVANCQMSQTDFDALSKLLFEALLHSLGRVERSLEVPGESMSDRCLFFPHNPAKLRSSQPRNFRTNVCLSLFARTLSQCSLTWLKPTVACLNEPGWKPKSGVVPAEKNAPSLQMKFPDCG